MIKSYFYSNRTLNVSGFLGDHKELRAAFRISLIDLSDLVRGNVIVTLYNRLISEMPWL